VQEQKEQSAGLERGDEDKEIQNREMLGFLSISKGLLLLVGD